MNTPSSEVHHRSSPDAKIALFRSLFRGREDVYPRRFESRATGKSCLHRTFWSVTDYVIRWHRSGQDQGGAEFTPAYEQLLNLPPNDRRHKG